VAGKLAGLAALIVLGALVVLQWPDIQRFAKIKLQSWGSGHPEYVPAAGRSIYPHQPGTGDPDGSGEFDAPSRGGPAAATGR
jgi:hypothetical protein